MWKSSIPVSYTHLDVYKRQLLFSPELVDFVVEGWEKLLPMYRFLREIHVEE